MLGDLFEISHRHNCTQAVSSKYNASRYHSDLERDRTCTAVMDQQANIEMGGFQKMVKNQETGMDRLKKIKLWQAGLLVIWAALMVAMLNVLRGPLGNSAEERAQELGRWAPVPLFILVGIGLIIAHFVRRSKR